MSHTPTRSEQVVESFKRRKLAHSAIRRIHELIRSFEDERITDKKHAKIGLVLILLLIGISIYFLTSGNSVVLR
jgi:hypothetical protein